MIWKIGKSYWRQDIKKQEYIAAYAKGIAGILLIAYLFYHSAVGALFLSPLFYFYYRQWYGACTAKKKQEFCNQFRESLQSFVTALNVGYSVENSIREVQKEMRTLFGAKAPVTREFAYILRQLEMNITVEKAFLEFADRVETEEVSSLATVFATIKRSGGDMIEVLRNTMEMLCMKMETQQEIQTIIAAKKMEFQVMSMIPLGIIIYMKVSFPEFMSVLYGNGFGIGIMTVCLAVYFAAYILGKNILRIEV